MAAKLFIQRGKFFRKTFAGPSPCGVRRGSGEIFGRCASNASILPRGVAPPTLQRRSKSEKPKVCNELNGKPVIAGEVEKPVADRAIGAPGEVIHVNFESTAIVVAHPFASPRRRRWTVPTTRAGPTR